jgi:hypothetical protein
MLDGAVAPAVDAPENTRPVRAELATAEPISPKAAQRICGAVDARCRVFHA